MGDNLTTLTNSGPPIDVATSSAAADGGQGHVSAVNLTVCIHTSTGGQSANYRRKRGRWKLGTYNLYRTVVDGEIVDLNRILLSPDTAISDERFKDPE